METAQILALYERHQRIEIVFPDMRKDVLPGPGIFPELVRFVRPAPGASFISYSRLDPERADAQIDAQVAYMHANKLAFSWAVFDHDSPPDLKQRLAARGGTLYEQVEVMVLDLQSAPAALLASRAETPEADVRAVTLPEQLEDIIQVEEAVWGGSFGWIRERLGGQLAIPGYLNVYAAYVDEQPVSAGWMYFHPGNPFANLYGGSTIKDQRGKGFYTALLAVRVQEALRRGARFLTIDAGPMSAPIVRKHGFQTIARAQDCEWEVSEGKEETLS